MDYVIIERNFPWEIDIDEILSKENRKKLNAFLTQDASLLLNFIYSMFVEENERRGLEYSNHMRMNFAVDDVQKKTKLSGQRQKKALDVLELCELIRVSYSGGNRRCVRFLFDNVSSFYRVFNKYMDSIKHPFKYYLQLKNAFAIEEEEEEIG